MSGRARKIVFAGLAVILFLGSSEALLRLAGFHYQPIPERIWLGRLQGGIPSAEVVFDRLVPGLFVRDGLLFWKPAAGKPPFNGAGLRADAELPPGKPATEFRVLALGDSCTFLGEPWPWPQRLASRLESGPGEVRVLNAGVPAYSSLQGLRLLESRIDELQPDVVTIYFGWNDHWRATVKPDAAFPVRDSGVVAAQSLLSHSRLYQALNYLLKGRRRAAPQQAPPLPEDGNLAAAATQRPFRVSAEEFAANLRAMVERTRQAGAQAVLITAPSTLSPDAVPNYLFAHGFVAQGGERIDLIHQRYAALVRQVARETGALLVDAAAAFAATADGGDGLMRADGIHLTAAGIERLADLVSAVVQPLQASRRPVSPAASNSR